MASKAAAICAGVSKSYATESETVEALRHVDAEFPSGVVNAVVGASGSGKSTLLRLLAALEPPTRGSVLVGGRELGRLSAADLRTLRRRHVAYVFQRPSENFIPELTLAEHMALVGEADDGRTGLAALARLGLGHYTDRYAQELSGGEQQRAALAQALGAGARLVVADEPTAELDARSSEELLAAIRELAEAGVTFILATHDRAVSAIADHIVELEHGAVKERGSYSRPLGRPPVSRQPDSERIVVELAGVTRLYERGEAVVGVEDIELDLREGEVMALFGRSGSGKTTVLNLIAGWERPDAGTISFPGMAGSADPSTLPWSEIGILPQRFGLFAELPVRANIEYATRLAGRQEENAAWIAHLLEALALTELAERVPAETSVGQQQRTALARALALRPRLLLADEPTSHQDAGSAAAIVEVLRKAGAGGTACLVATHDEEFAAACDTTFRLAAERPAPVLD